MKRQILKTAATAIIVALASTGVALADQRPRNPGAAGGSSSGGSSGGDTGRVASPRGGGGGSTWSGGGSSGRSTPSTPASTPSTRSRRGGSERSGGAVTVPSYSRPRDGAPVTGRAVPRSSIGTLPPIISGPIYWGNNSWYFYPWGYGAMGLGYLWDPWLWSGYGYYGGGYPYWGDTWAGSGYGYGYGNYGGSGGYSASSSIQGPEATGGLRLKVKPRNAEVHVGGYFAGKVDDFDGAFQKLKLPAGPHQVDIKADGYETLTLDVLIVEDEVTTYQGDLVPEP